MDGVVIGQDARLPANGTWLPMGFFRAVPREIEEAAIVGSCSLFGAFVKMVLPLSLPAILTIVIFSCTLTLQEFVYALTFISSSAQKTITLGVATDLFLDRFIAGGAVK